MITIKNKSSIQKMEEAGARLSAIFEEIKPLVKAGNSTIFLNDLRNINGIGKCEIIMRFGQNSYI